MYVPPHFAENDQAKLQQFIEDHSFGLLVTQDDGEPFASHVPFLMEKTADGNGLLVGHMARSNPQWQQAAGQMGLAIFSGPHAYISPTWYEAKNVVPTWNYVAVHAYGRIEIVEDPGSLLEIVRQSVDRYEKPFDRPWSLEGSRTYVERMLMQIVGFRLTIGRLEGKWKLNQNHPTQRRRKVANALRALNHGDDLAIAKLIEASLPAEE